VSFPPCFVAPPGPREKTATVPSIAHGTPIELIRSALFHQLRPSPDYRWVGSCINSFEACSAFTRVTTCRLTKSPYATLSTGGFDGSVTPPPLRLLPGGAIQFPGGSFLPLWTSAFSRRTVIGLLATVIEIELIDSASERNWLPWTGPKLTQKGASEIGFSITPPVPRRTGEDLPRRRGMPQFFATGGGTPYDFSQRLFSQLIQPSS
jgi:hypothetical protein